MDQHQIVSALRATGITKTVASDAGPKAILGPLSLEIPTGSFSVISGRSGAGKTTLLSILGLLDRDFAGELRLFGETVSGFSESRLAALRLREIGFVFQIPRLFSGLSVWQNLTATAWIGGQSFDHKRAAWLLERVGLGHSKGRLGGLSGGERQRLTVARALLKRPRLLLCDEPTGNLDQQTGDEILQLIDELRQEEKVTTVMVSHDPAIIARAEQQLRLVAGRLDP